MENGYSLSDIAAISNSESIGGNNLVTLLLLFALISGNGLFGARGDYGQYATAASQQEILFGQQFQNIDNKIDRLGNGIADATFALNNSVKDGNSMVAGRVVDEGRAIQSQIADCCCANQKNTDALRYDMATMFANTNANITASSQKVLDALAQDKIASLQAQVSELKTQNMFCGIPRISNVAYGVYPYATSNVCGCNCGNL